MSCFDAFTEELNKYRYKIDLHVHTNPASSCGQYTPEQLVRVYSDLGYDALVLTNHMHMERKNEGESDEDYIIRFNDDYIRTCEAAKETGLCVIYGMEIRFPNNRNDYLVYGVDETESGELFPHLRGDLFSFRRDYKKDSMVLIQAHPCRRGCTRAEIQHLDGVEVINMHPFHRNSPGFAAKFACEVGGIVTSGSDFHHPGTAGLGGIYTKVLPRDTHELAGILRSGDYLLDVGGYPMLPIVMNHKNNLKRITE